MDEMKVAEITLDPRQQEAIALGCDLSQRLVAVSGAAGTGKTTITRKIYEQLRAQGISIALAAPTGKAARRIKEATGIDAVTIHKLLEYNRPGDRDPETGKALDPTKPNRTRQNPLDQKVILVDEYAMVNYELHNNLVAALPAGGCIRAFGDMNQLPPIEPYAITNKDGSVADTPFQKLLKNHKGVILEHVYRQGEGSNVLLNADRIRKGHTPTLNQDLGDWCVVITDKPTEVLKKHVQKSLEVGINYGHIENQIIVPGKKTWVGTQKLNGLLRSILNPRPVQSVELARHKWDKDSLTVGIGDKVVCTSNTYDMRPYFERFSEWTDEMKPIMASYIPCPPTKQMLNGETGVITQIYPDGGLDIDFGDRIVEVPEKYEEYWSQRDTVIDTYPTRDIDLAYALTTHKCQGSEFKQICYVMNKSSQFTQSRQNFYTAVTRASQRAFVFTDQTSLRVSLFKIKK